MDLNTYQFSAAATAGTGPTRLPTAALGLSGEAGEVCDHVKKHIGHGHPLDTEKIAAELGDVLWYVADLATQLGLSLSMIAHHNLEKLRRRYPNGFTPEASINRKE